MGIKYLNKYLQSNCSNSIKQISLHDLKNKRIVIDTSIYLYRFLGEKALLENFYLMISIFREHNIIPLFVFDGKPPKEKYDLLEKRKKDKKEAEYKYKQLEYELTTNLHTMDTDEKREMEDTMNSLKKEFIRIHHTDIENVKMLIQAYGVSYVEAPGEADKLCAKMVCKNKAYACLSEDMDLFVYGCNRVLRYLSLLNKTVVLYTLKDMMSELNITHDEFRSLCIVSGTDYNISGNSDNNHNLLNTVKYFKKYKKEMNTKNSNNNNNNSNNNSNSNSNSNNNNNNNTSIDFYKWLEDNTNYITSSLDMYIIHDMFAITDMPEYKQYDKLNISNGPVNKSNLITVMEKEHFLFA
jgi:5'-3' exonuclease